jgi:hypothetical protein
VPDSSSFLPDADEFVVEHTVVDAGPSHAYTAIGRADVSGNRLLGLLGGVADLVDRMAGAAVQPKTLDELLGPDFGFVPLADEPGTLRVAGVVVRYSLFDRGVERLAPEQFASFAEPGHLKAVIAFSLRPQDGGRTLLSCEARVRATDEDTRSTLHTSWFVVGAGFRMLARRLLELIKAEAERSSSSGP